MFSLENPQFKNISFVTPSPEYPCLNILQFLNMIGLVGINFVHVSYMYNMDIVSHVAAQATIAYLVAVLGPLTCFKM